MILEGENPYDIFVRWETAERAVNRLEPGPQRRHTPQHAFRFSPCPTSARKGAGVLRDKPKINWNKDGGKDLESTPWYHMFKGDRINDYHLSLVEKRVSREQNHA